MLSAIGTIHYLTALGELVPDAAPLVALLDVPAEPDTLEIDELGLTTAAELVVEEVVTSGFVIVEAVVDIDPPISSPVRLSLSELSTMIVLLAVTLIMLNNQKPMELDWGLILCWDCGERIKRSRTTNMSSFAGCAGCDVSNVANGCCISKFGVMSARWILCQGEVYEL